MRLRVQGDGVGFAGKTSSCTTLKLRFGAAREQSGAGFIGLRIVPEFVPMPAPDAGLPQKAAVQAGSAYVRHFFDAPEVFHWFLTMKVEIRRRPWTGSIP
jgi:hypothetical protein